MLVYLAIKISFLYTVLTVLITGFLGIFFIKRQGRATFSRIQSSLANGNIPTLEMVQGLILLAAGLLLVTPGVITDGIGVLLLLPPVRYGAAKLIISRFKNRFKVINIASDHLRSGPFISPDRNTIDGEWEEEKPGK